MKTKLIAIVFVILLLLAAVPFSFTEGAQVYLFGWLPLALAYWWILMIVNLVFVLLVCKSFVKHSTMNDEKEEEGNE